MVLGSLSNDFYTKFRVHQSSDLKVEIGGHTDNMVINSLHLSFLE